MYNKFNKKPYKKTNSNESSISPFNLWDELVDNQGTKQIK